MSGDDGRMHDGHRRRMRERRRVMGLDGFAPHEAVELLLFYVIPQRDVNPLAHRLIDEFGTLGACLSAGEERLTRVPGVGARTAEFLTAIGKSCELYASFSDNRMDLSKLKFIVKYLKPLLACVESGRTWAVCMDKMGRLAGAGEVSRHGWLDADMIKNALRLVIKNHASMIALVDKRALERAGVTGEDVRISVEVARTMARIGVFTIDMLISSGDEFISLRNRNLFDPALGVREGNESLVRLYTGWLD